MRTLIFILVLAGGSWAGAVERLKVYDAPLIMEPSPYEGLNLSPAQLAAAQELELAQYRFVAWANFEFPQRLRQIDADILLAREEIASWQRRQTEYNHFNVWTRGGNPFFLESELSHLSLVALQQRLQLLVEERGQLLRFQPVEYRERQMAVERARQSLRLAR
jgi:hypothetical protein